MFKHAFFVKIWQKSCDALRCWFLVPHARKTSNNIFLVFCFRNGKTIFPEFKSRLSNFTKKFELSESTILIRTFLIIMTDCTPRPTVWCFFYLLLIFDKRRTQINRWVWPLESSRDTRLPGYPVSQSSRLPGQNLLKSINNKINLMKS